jgi:Holliday junction DNA helicase RuvA
VDRALFRILIKINGVGARLALALMSGMTANEMTAAIQMEDVGAFVRIPGVGKKTAARLMVELRDRLEAWQPNEVGVTGSTSSADFVVDSVRDSVSALISLGYKPPEASRMVRNVDTVGLTSEQIIKQALRAVTN